MTESVQPIFARVKSRVSAEISTSSVSSALFKKPTYRIKIPLYHILGSIGRSPLTILIHFIADTANPIGVSHFGPHPSPVVDIFKLSRLFTFMRPIKIVVTHDPIDSDSWASATWRQLMEFQNQTF
jgi:hypothetical protein